MIKTAAKGYSTRIKGIVSCHVDGSPNKTIFKSRTLALKVQMSVGEKDQFVFYESYNSRPGSSKGETLIEWAMKGLEEKGKVRRIMSKTWEKIVD